jgi:N-acetylglucosamine-6-phosphate deacetylase
MSKIVFVNGTAILPDRLFPDAEVDCREGRIDYVGKRRRRSSKTPLIVDARGGYISPGFIDIHVHGGAGADFMDGTIDAVQVNILFFIRGDCPCNVFVGSPSLGFSRLFCSPGRGHKT